MALSLDVSIGGGNEKVSDTSISIPISVASVAVGKLVFVAFATDNISAAADSESATHNTVTDSKGNTYTKQVEWTNAQGAGAAGACVSIWTSILTTALTSAGSDTITLTCTGNATAKAGAAGACSIGAGSTIAREAKGTLSNDGADTGSISLTPSVSREYLFIRATAHEGPNADAYTATASYAQYGSGTLGTSGGSGVTNMSVRMEARVLTTGSSEATDPTYTAADHAAAMIALYEVVTVTAVPNPIINRYPVVRAATY